MDLYATQKLIQAEPHGTRGILVRRLADAQGLSVRQLYRRLRKIARVGSRGQAGVKRRRKPRSDAGRSALSDHHARLVAGYVFGSRRLDGRIPATFKHVTAWLIARGDIPPVSPATVRRRCKQLGLTRAAMNPTHVYLPRKTRPGELFLLDSSVCMTHYFPDPSKGLRPIPAAVRQRLHKPETSRELKVHIKRYFIIDHASTMMAGRYVAAAGETAHDTIDALIHAFLQLGVPQALYLDHGPGNTAFETKLLCSLLGVRLLYKGGASPSAMGAVECRHNIVQQQLEWRFNIEPPDNLAQLNDLTARWLSRLNHHSRVRATDSSPFDLHRRADEGLLTVCPDPATLRACLHKRPARRKVRGDATVTFNGQIYRLPRSHWHLRGTAQHVALDPYHPGQAMLLVGYDPDSCVTDAKIALTRITTDQFGFASHAVPFNGNHPVAPTQLPTTRQLRQARQIAVAHKRALRTQHQLDAFTDLPDTASARNDQALQAAFLGSSQNSAFPVPRSALQEQSYPPADAIRLVAKAVHQATGRPLSRRQGAELHHWLTLDAVPQTQITRTIDRLLHPQPKENVG